MSLAQDAHADFIDIMKDDMGAVVVCTITKPDGSELEFDCRHSDTHMDINAGTDEVVTGRQVSVSVLISELIDAGYEDVRGIARSDEKPWKVTVPNVLGVSGTYKVIESYPDGSLGNMVLFLEIIE